MLFKDDISESFDQLAYPPSLSLSLSHLMFVQQWTPLNPGSRLIRAAA